MSEDTIPKLFRTACKQSWDRRVALRQMRWGIWVPYTWKHFHEEVKHFSLGLLSLGLERGDKVMIIGNGKPQWFYAQFAAMCAGAVVTGAFPDSGPSEIEYLINHSQSKFVVVEDQEQVDKLTEINDKCPNVKKVIYWDRKGLQSYDNLILMAFEDISRLGQGYEKEKPELFEHNVDISQAEDPVFIGYTSGTTGRAKAVMHSSRSLLAAAQALWGSDPAVKSDQYLCSRTLCVVDDLIFNTIPALEAGAATNFPEKIEEWEQAFRQIGQPKLVTIPLILQMKLSWAQAQIAQAGGLKRLFTQLFMPVGYRIADFKLTGENPSIFWKAMKAISHIMLFRSILDWLGFVKIKVMYVAGAASSEAFRFLLANGIDVRTLYGLAEMMPISAHQKGDFDPETSGTVVRGCTVRITEQGEVLAKGPNRMMGYYNDSENTNKAIDKKGWLHTGDAGFFNETGHLVIKDRMLDLITLDDGTVFSPIYIENKLKSCPYIKNVVIVGQGKPFAAALISIDFGNVSAWAANNHIAYATFADLSQNEEVYSLIKPYLLKTNLGLPERQRLKSFALLSEELDPRDGGLTRTLQLRRSFVLRIYADFVEALYGNGPRALTDTEVEYRDGRKAGAKTTIKIMTLEAETP